MPRPKNRNERAWPKNWNRTKKRHKTVNVILNCLNMWGSKLVQTVTSSSTSSISHVANGGACHCRRTCAIPLRRISGWADRNGDGNDRNAGSQCDIIAPSNVTSLVQSNSVIGSSSGVTSMLRNERSLLLSSSFLSSSSSSSPHVSWSRRYFSSSSSRWVESVCCYLYRSRVGAFA